MAGEKVIILYCGSHLAKNLYDKLLRFRLCPIMLPSDTPLEDIRRLEASALMITGSPSYVNDPVAEKVDQEIYNSGIPILGICYGMQLITKNLGGQVKKMPLPERGPTHLALTDNISPLFLDFTEEGAPVWMIHNSKVTAMPPGFIRTAVTEQSEIAAMENTERGIYAVQFHPEHRGNDPATSAGTAILWRFLHEVCGIDG